MFPNLNANPPLFGAGAGTGLFGAQNKPPAGAPTGGLFGAQLPAQQGAGLFAQPQGGQQPSAMNNNLFGGQPTGNANAGGLFGNQPKPAASFLGGGQNPQGQPQPNLMGGPPATQNTMFQGAGAQQNPLGAQATAQQPGQQPTGLFAAGGQAVGGGLFNAPKPGPVGVQIGGQATGPVLGGQNFPQAGPVDPNKNPQGDQNKGQLSFGADIHKKGSPSKDSQAIMQQAISQHMTIEELFRKWKKDLEEQVNDFLKLGRDLNKDERDLYDMNSMLSNLNSNMKQLESDYGHIQTSLGGLERQQDELIRRLNQIEGDLTQALPQETEETHMKSSSNLLNKAKELNKETIQIEKQVEKLVDDVNQPLKDYNEDVNKILNSYYEALEYIELDTMMIQTKLNDFERVVERNGL